MYLELSIDINRPQKEGSPVLLLEKTTADPVGMGTKYREIVQMLPYYKSEILSVITRYEPYEFLEEDFSATGMSGHLAYQFIDKDGSTQLIQRESIFFTFPLNLFNPIIKNVLHRKLAERLEEIKADLES